jgi:hypothetical protein
MDMPLPEAPSPKHNKTPWAPTYEGIVSVEHRKCLELADQLCGEAEKKFPKYFEKLRALTDVDTVLETEDWTIEVGEDAMPLGTINEAEYTLAIKGEERAEESRDKHPDPDQVNLTTKGRIRMRIKTTGEKFNRPLYEATIEISKCADEEAYRPLQIVGTVPIMRKSSTSGGPVVSVTLEYNDDTVIPRHPMALHRIAASTDPELGDYALRGIREVLEGALKHIRT